MTADVDITNQKFNELTALRYDHHQPQAGGHPMAIWLFRCSCGTEKLLLKHSVTTGNTKSCGSGCRKKDPLIFRRNRMAKFAYLKTVDCNLFTKRQKQVIDLLVQGDSQVEIADKLQVAQSTISSTVNNKQAGGILKKIKKAKDVKKKETKEFQGIIQTLIKQRNHQREETKKLSAQIRKLQVQWEMMQ